MEELEVGNVFWTHDWGVDEEVEILSIMQQSIKLKRASGETYFQAPGSINNHRGLKEWCPICEKKENGDHTLWSLKASAKSQGSAETS